MKGKLKRDDQSHASEKTREKIRSFKRRIDQEEPAYYGPQENSWGMGSQLGNLGPLET